MSMLVCKVDIITQFAKSLALSE